MRIPATAIGGYERSPAPQTESLKPDEKLVSIHESRVTTCCGSSAIDDDRPIYSSAVVTASINPEPAVRAGGTST